MSQLTSYLDTPRGVIEMILGFCFIIFIHELGHFLAAKLVDMKVTQFSIGIGPALFSWRKGIGFRRGSTEPEYERRIKDYLAARGEDITVESATDAKIKNKARNDAATALGLGETEYRINWVVPLGGYVKLLGQEDLKPDAVSDDERSFTRKSGWARSVVLSAGVIMNVILAVVFFIAAFMAGIMVTAPVVGDVAPHSPAAETYAQGHENDAAFKGLRPDDRIIEVNGAEATDFSDLALGSALTKPGNYMDLSITRAGVAEPLTFAIRPESIAGKRFLDIGVDAPRSLKIGFDPKLSPPPMNEVADESVITAVDGKPVKTFNEFDKLISQARGRDLAITFTQPDKKDVTVPLHAWPSVPVGDDGSESILGLVQATKVKMVVERSPAEVSGVKAGDVIAKLGPQPWPSFEQIVEIAGAHKSRPIDLVVLRDGAEVELPQVTPSGTGKIGIGRDEKHTYIAKVLPNSPLANLDLNGGTQIVSVDGKPIKDFGDLAREVTNAGKGPLVVGYQKNIKDTALATASVQLTAAQLKEVEAIEWVAPPMNYEELRILLVARNPLDATHLGLKKTWQFILQTYITLARVGEGNVSISEFRGAWGITAVGTKMALMGWPYFCFFLGLISVNLAVMNFLPIPVLDGGQMLFLFIEKIKGRPLSMRTQEIATYIGLAIIVSLLLVTLYNDIGRTFGFAG